MLRVDMGFWGGLISFVWMVNQDQLACLWMLRVENVCFVWAWVSGGCWAGGANFVREDDELGSTCLFVDVAC